MGLATEPADRDTAEQILTRLYRRRHRAQPRSGDQTCILVDRPTSTTPLTYRDGWHPPLRQVTRASGHRMAE